jgi:Flp pilus assembly protein protease CpaA
MDPLLIIKILIILIATGIAAYTDHKTSYIYNWLTFPLVIVGVILTALESFVLTNPLGYIYFIKVISIAIIIYFLGYLFYYFGKLGGGDIKIFIGIHLVLPYYASQLTILWLLIFSSLLAVMFVSLQYLIKLYIILKWKTWKKILLKKKLQILKVIILFLAFVFIIGYSIKVLQFPKLYYLLLIPIILGLKTMVFEEEIRKYIYLKRKEIKDLEDGDVLAIDFIPKDLLLKLKLGKREVLEEKDIIKIKKLNLKTLPIYDNLPRFGPYILLGIIVFLIVGKYLL